MHRKTEGQVTMNARSKGAGCAKPTAKPPYCAQSVWLSLFHYKCGMSRSSLGKFLCPLLPSPACHFFSTL